MDRKKLIKEVKKFKEKIKKKYNPENIILFGSRASGKPHKNSDVDLIIVSKKFRGKKSFKRSPELYIEWHLNINLPVDFLCYTPEEFEKKRRNMSRYNLHLNDLKGGKF